MMVWQFVPKRRKSAMQVTVSVIERFLTVQAFRACPENAFPKLRRSPRRGAYKPEKCFQTLGPELL